MHASATPGQLAPRRSWPVWWLAGLPLLVWMAGAIWPRLLVTLGIYDYGKVYLDSYAVLAALDAVRAGADPHAVNPLDVLLRPHVYSDWWLSLRGLGLTREHNFLVGTVWAAAFGAAAWVTARPRTPREAWWLVALLVSPPVLLSVSRANNDLVIFVLLAGCGLAASASAWGRVFFAVACLWLATGLKYFTAPAALAFLWVRPVRKMPAVLLAGLVAVVLAFASVWTQVDRSRFTIGSGVYTMGAPLWGRDFGWKDKDITLPGLLLIVLAALFLWRSRTTTGLASRGEPRQRLLAALGAIVLLTCFVAGMNYAYRWIFALWPAVWMWREAADVSAPARSRWAARLGCFLVMACLWMDGGLCVAVNLFFAQYAQAWQNHLDVVWRHWTQPLHWLLMMLLAGWLLEGALVTAREWWAARHEQ
jgi:hypothetical protein